MNGEICWSKADLLGTVGTQECGSFSKFSKEETFRVIGCYVTLSGPQVKSPLTVRVWTNLDEDVADESFGIDNVFIQRGEVSLNDLWSTLMA